MSGPSFDLDRVRLEAAQRLPAHCFDDFQRLAKRVLHGPTFQWLLVEAPADALRRQVVDALDRVLRAAKLQASRLPLGRKIADVPALEEALVRHAARYQVVHLLGRPGWFDAQRWAALNVRRERIAGQARARLIFWLDAPAIELASRHAPDMWAWRGGVYTFVSRAAEVSTGDAPQATLSSLFATLPPEARSWDKLSLAERHRRIAEVRGWLESNSGAPDELVGPALTLLGLELYMAEDFEAALAHWRDTERPWHAQRSHILEVAETSGRIADLLTRQGQLDESLRILRDEVLPAYERSGDERARTGTMRKIANILQTQGHLDEAERILRAEVLPAYERLGDEHSCTATLQEVAAILRKQGQMDQALRILREEVLPRFERLGDTGARAAAMEEVAGILGESGELDEALRILREEVLPAYEQLGDAISRASAMGDVSFLLLKRNQNDEAVRIFGQEVLPVYERMPNMQRLALGRTLMAGLLLLRGGPGDREEADRLQQLALADMKRLKLPVAEKVRALRKKIGFGVE